MDLKLKHDRLTADFAIFNVLMASVFAQVQQHGNLLATVGTFEAFLEFEFHGLKLNQISILRKNNDRRDSGHCQ